MGGGIQSLGSLFNQKMLDIDQAILIQDKFIALAQFG